MIKNTFVQCIFCVALLSSPVAIAQHSTTHTAASHSSAQTAGHGAPPDARDPHTHSAGYTLTEGPYAQEGPRQLVLSDEHSFWNVMADHLEYNIETKSTRFDTQAWVGTTYDRLVIKAEGDIDESIISESQVSLLWGHAFSAFWDAQLGVSFFQSKQGDDRQWLAFAVQGLAPYWIDVDVTALVGARGRTALSLKAEYDLLLTQRLILQPTAEFMVYGRSDEANGVGSGLSQAHFGLRMRYEISRQFAPYIGFVWMNDYGNTRKIADAAGQHSKGKSILAGLRFWF